VLLPALRHRLLLNFDAEADRVTSDAILRQVLEQVPVDAG
jgi:MoxR-like ATPase